MSEHTDQHSERDPDAADQQSGQQAREQYDRGTDGEPYAAAGEDSGPGEPEDPGGSLAEQAKQREREMEESGEESPA
jgi:hypothetical protein